MTTKEAQGLPQDTLVAEIEAHAVGAESIGEDGIAGVLREAAALIRSLSEANATLGDDRHRFIHERDEYRVQLSAATAEIERLKGALEKIESNATGGGDLALILSVSRTALAASNAEAAEGGQDATVA